MPGLTTNSCARAIAACACALGCTSANTYASSVGDAGQPATDASPPQDASSVDASSVDASSVDASSVDAADPDAADCYVAPGGSDDNPGTQDKPFRTIQRAADAMQPGQLTYIRTGVYRETVRPPASGQAGAPIRFQAYPGESPVVSGADELVVSWSVDSGAVYRATTSLTFTQLFVNRRMMNEARWPNAKIDELVRMPRASTDTASTTSLSASAIPAGNWGGALVHVTTGEEWVSFTRKVKNYDESARRFDFSEPIAPSDAIRPEAGDPFYLFGHRGLLDTGGEWYLDDDHDTIYLWTPEGTNPASVTVEVKARNYAFDLSNRSHIELVGLHIFAAGVHMDRAHHCVVDGCHIRYVNHVREVNGYATNEGVGGVTSGSFNEWRNGSIAHAAVSGVVVNGNNNKVTNMLIHDVDYVGNGFAGISSGQKSWASADQNEYTHNTIYNTGGFGITHYKTTRSRISFNEVYNVMLLTKDGAPIYTWGTDGQGTEISYNHVHHNQTHWGAGIYLDDASSINHVVHHNLIEDIAWWGILFKGNNLIYNNTVIKAGDRGIFINQAAADLSGVKIVNNLLFQTGGALDFGREAQNVEQHHNAVCATDADRFPTDPTCIDSGEANAYTGEHRGTAPDIGAFEVGAPSWLPSVGCTTAERSPGGH